MLNRTSYYYHLVNVKRNKAKLLVFCLLTFLVECYCNMYLFIFICQYFCATNVATIISTNTHLQERFNAINHKHTSHIYDNVFWPFYFQPSCLTVIFSSPKSRSQLFRPSCFSAFSFSPVQSTKDNFFGNWSEVKLKYEEIWKGQCWREYFWTSSLIFIKICDGNEEDDDDNPSV